MSENLLCVDTCISTPVSKGNHLKVLETKQIGFYIEKTLKENLKN